MSFAEQELVANESQKHQIFNKKYCNCMNYIINKKLFSVKNVQKMKEFHKVSWQLNLWHSCCRVT